MSDWTAFGQEAPVFNPPSLVSICENMIKINIHMCLDQPNLFIAGEEVVSRLIVAAGSRLSDEDLRILQEQHEWLINDTTDRAWQRICKQRWSNPEVQDGETWRDFCSRREAEIAEKRRLFTEKQKAKWKQRQNGEAGDSRETRKVLIVNGRLVKATSAAASAATGAAAAAASRVQGRRKQSQRKVEAPTWAHAHGREGSMAKRARHDINSGKSARQSIQSSSAGSRGFRVGGGGSVVPAGNRSVARRGGGANMHKMTKLQQIKGKMKLSKGLGLMR